MSQIFEQWNESFKLFQPMVPLNSKILERFTFVEPEYRVNLANTDELLQFFRTITGLNMSFPYLNVDMTNFKNTEELLQKQMSIAVEWGQTTLDYMQKSFQIMEKAILLLMDETKYKPEEKQ